MADIRPRIEQALSGSYTIERELGGGGMSRTYLARETALQRRVVVKVLAPELLAGISVERFRREVLLAAGLQHPHVVPVLTTGEVDGIPWFSMPYVDGDSLRHRLQSGELGIGESVGILRDVARALAYAHGHRIVHRDIKPDNVLLSGGSATVTDFGIAKAINAARTGGADHPETLTQVGTSIGTPAYMAPEQAAGDPNTDHRADLYAFGVMAFEMLAGRTPFVAGSPAKLLAAHMSEKAPDIAAIRLDCPPALASLVMRCLEKEPEARPQDAGELVRVLDSVTSSSGGAAVPEILRGGSIRLGRAIGLWALATVLVTLTAWAARETIGLPEWVLPGAVGVMLAGLPVLLFTAYVQRTAHRAFTATPHRTPVPQSTIATLAMKASPHVSWRRTWLGGAVAVGGFAVLVIAYMVMRAAGIGPMGSLRGQGAFGDREVLMIADFRSPPSDSTLGATVAEALRTDLAQSSSLTVLTRSVIREALTLMQRSPEEAVPYALAREIATREGAKAVLDGAISQLGQSYVITARLASALDGGDLATFREQAANENELLPALGRLSKEIRTKAGESLKSVRASSELERVTTPSLAALRKYVEGSRLADEMGETERGMELIREAVEIDTAFAMAWRKLSVLLNNEGRDRASMIEATATAYRHRDRLTEMERLLTEAWYFSRGPSPDRQKALAAYEKAIELDSLNTAALNNAAVLHGEMNDYQRAEELYRNVVNLPRTFGGAFTNLLQMQILNGRPPAALDSTVASYRETFGSSNDFWEAEWLAAWGKNDLDAADSIARAVYSSRTTARQAIRSSAYVMSISELRGQIKESIRWQTRRAEAFARVAPGPGSRLYAGLDSAYYEIFYGTRPVALAIIERVRDRIPMDEIPASERPWGYLSFLGAFAGEPRITRDALQGFDRDEAALAYDPAGRRASFEARHAIAEERWADAITAATTAEQRFSLDPREADGLRAVAYRAMGNTDSAIYSFEQFLNTPDAGIEADGTFRAQALLQLGELYEAKGQKATAIEYYARFTEQWTNADPELQPRVRQIRERIAKLQGDIG